MAADHDTLTSIHSAIPYPDDSTLRKELGLLGPIASRYDIDRVRRRLHVFHGRHWQQGRPDFSIIARDMEVSGGISLFVHP
jgi:hypothetical protein